jgi:catechol 2,3-dioxygenase-like lactoylglutathione lyase family enzyme
MARMVAPFSSDSGGREIYTPAHTLVLDRIPTEDDVVPVIHHSAICVRNLDASLRFWRDGLGFTVLMDERFPGDWPTLFGAPTTSLRAVFLGDPSRPDTGIVELVDLGTVPGPENSVSGPAGAGVLLLSVITDLDAALGRLASLSLGGTPGRIEVAGVGLAVVTDPDGVRVELVDSGARANLAHLTATVPEDR